MQKSRRKKHQEKLRFVLQFVILLEYHVDKVK